MEMRPYLFAFDLDGTACNHTGHLGEKTRCALTAARAQGHLICFATGRRDIDMYSFWEESRYADYLLLNNGGKLVRTEDRAILFNNYIASDIAKQLIEHCLKNGEQLHVISGNYWASTAGTMGCKAMWTNWVPGLCATAPWKNFPGSGRRALWPQRIWSLSVNISRPANFLCPAPPRSRGAWTLWPPVSANGAVWSG